MLLLGILAINKQYAASFSNGEVVLQNCKDVNLDNKIIIEGSGNTMTGNTFQYLGKNEKISKKPFWMTMGKDKIIIYGVEVNGNTVRVHSLKIIRNGKDEFTWSE